MAARGTRTAPHTYAQEYIDDKLYSGVYSRVPLLTLMAHKGGSVGKLGSGEGRPDAGAIIGSMPSKSKLKSLAGSTQAHVRWHKQDSTVTKYITRKGTNASAGSNYVTDDVATAYFSWFKMSGAIQVAKSDVDMAEGPYKIASALEEAADFGISGVIDDLATDFFTNNPSDQTDDLAEGPIGIQQAIDSGNNYGGVDRSLAANANWRAKEVGTAKNATLDLIDDANITQGVANKGPGIDAIITTNAIYAKLKKQANARQQLITTQSMPDEAVIGFLKESFVYNGVVVTFDPQCPASHVFGLTMNDWCMEVHPNYNFRITKFKDKVEEGEHGVADVLTANILLMGRFYCKRPWNQIKYSSVS